MFILEYKVKPAKAQIQAIEEAIRTTQFVRNKILRHWMDNRGVGKTELFRYNTQLREEFDFVKALNSHACQTAVERVLRAINRFYDNCKKQVKGKKPGAKVRMLNSEVSSECKKHSRGYPKFSKTTRSVEYKTSGWKLSKCKKYITFTDKKKIGKLKLIGSRDLNFFSPEQIKRVRILRKADGYYVQFCINLDPRVTVQPLTPSQKAVGIDVGLKVFLADSQGNTVKIPQFYRKAEKQLNRLNRKKSKKFRKGQPQGALSDARETRARVAPQSQNYRKARSRYARKHLKVSRQREEFAKTVALRYIQSNDLVAYEDLNVKGLVKNRHLSKSISDAGWSTFCKWLEYFADKYGKIAVAVAPYNTSQNCSNCGKKVQKGLSTRTHVCPHCEYVEDRDVNASLNILQLGLSTVGRTETNMLGEFGSLAELDT